MLECYVSQYMIAEYKMDMWANSFHAIVHIKSIVLYSNKLFHRKGVLIGFSSCPNIIVQAELYF
jgi:hypothetical protein